MVNLGAVQGYVDTHDPPDTLCGWAIQEGNPEPLRIQVLGPEGLLGAGTADQSREPSAGNCGFRIKLSRPIPTSDLFKKNVNVYATDADGDRQLLAIWENIAASVEARYQSGKRAPGRPPSTGRPALDAGVDPVQAWIRENSTIRQNGDPTTMLNDEELRMLRWLAGRYYCGAGSIIDAGAFLGGSTIALCKGLRDAGWIGRIIHSFDLLIADAYSVEYYRNGRFLIGSSTRALYDQAVEPYADLLSVHEGDITQMEWHGGGIEILFLDCLKTPKVNDFCLLTLFRHLIPGRSIIIQQDYLWDQSPWLHISMEVLWNHFDLLCDTEYDSVVFLNKKPISESALPAACWSAMSFEQRRALMDRTINRWDGEKREHLLNAKRSGGLA
jgi:hypothetical protein